MILLSFIPATARAQATKAELPTSCIVASITDGDTFRCTTGERIRLLLIDAPERNQRPFGALATKALRSLVAPQDSVVLELDVQKTDRYGRILAYAYLADGHMINEEMGRLGYVVAIVYPPNVRYIERIRAAVDSARRAKRGLWATKAFECTPADHRRRRC